MRSLTSSGSVRRGVVYIYASLILALFSGLASSSVTARLMSESDLGLYRFVISCVTVLTSALTFGVFSSAGTLLAGKPRRIFSEMVIRGAGTQAWIIAAACMFGVCGILLVAEWSKPLNLWIAVAGLLAGVMAWPPLILEILRARGNFIGLAVMNAAPTVLFLLFLVASQIFMLPLDGAICVSLFCLSQGIVVFSLMKFIRIPVRPDKKSYVFTLRKNVSIGLNVYWASFLAALMAQSGIFTLQAFGKAEDVAIFALAVTVSAPLSMLPSAVGTAYFSRLSGVWGFPVKTLRNAWLVSGVAAILFCLIAPYAIHFLYGEKFASVTIPAQICGIGSVLHGMADVYNRYYLVNRDTRFLLRNVVQIFIFSFAFVVPGGFVWGVIGVSVAKLVASCTYVFTMIFYYHVALRRFGDETI